MQVFGNGCFGVIQLFAGVAQLAFGVVDLAAGIGHLHLFVLQGGPAILQLGAGSRQLLFAVLVLGQAVIVLLPAIVQLGLGGGQFGGVGFQLGTGGSQLSRALFVLQQAQPVLGQLTHAGNQFFQLGFAVLGQAGPPGFDSGVQLVPDVIGQFGGELTRPIDSILQSRLHGGRVVSISHGGDIRPGLLQALLLFFRQGVCGDFIDGRQQIVGLGADGIHLLLRQASGDGQTAVILDGLPQFFHRLGRLGAVGIAVLGQPADKRIHLGRIHSQLFSKGCYPLLVGGLVGVQLGLGVGQLLFGGFNLCQAVVVLFQSGFVLSLAVF